MLKYRITLNILKIFKRFLCYNFLFHFMMQPFTEMKKIGWATDGGGWASSGMKFFFKMFILTWNEGLLGIA